MIRYMVADMATYGGYAPATDHEAWETLSAAVAAELDGQNSKYAMAEAANGLELRALIGDRAPLRQTDQRVVGRPGVVVAVADRLGLGSHSWMHPHIPHIGTKR